MLTMSTPIATTYHETTKPRFEEGDGRYTLIGSGEYTIGAYVATVPLASLEGEWIAAEVDATAEGEGSRAMALLLFYNEKDEKLQSDFLSEKDGHYEVRLKVPEGAVRAVFEMIGDTRGGRITFSCPKVTECAPKRDRSFIAAVGYFKREGTTEANMRAVLSLIDLAGAAEEKPDILCFTEGVHSVGVGHNVYITPDHEDILRVREAARCNAMYVLFPYHEEAPYRYNTAILIDPQGEVVGKYNKVQPTLGELRNGIVPGRELPVFDLPFARVGILICWDQYFYETSRALVKKGAEVILWASRGYHDERMVTRARDNGVYYVCAHPFSDRCVIAGPAGWKVLARGEGEYGYIAHRIDPDERPVSEYKSFGKNGGNDKEIYLNELRRDLY